MAISVSFYFLVVQEIIFIFLLIFICSILFSSNRVHKYETFISYSSVTGQIISTFQARICIFIIIVFFLLHLRMSRHQTSCAVYV
jgi:hypothetical protein